VLHCAAVAHATTSEITGVEAKIAVMRSIGLEEKLDAVYLRRWCSRVAEQGAHSALRNMRQAEAGWERGHLARWNVRSLKMLMMLLMMTMAEMLMMTSGKPSHCLPRRCTSCSQHRLQTRVSKLQRALKMTTIHHDHLNDASLLFE
jgi:hypothetical protein